MSRRLSFGLLLLSLSFTACRTTRAAFAIDTPAGATTRTLPQGALVGGEGRWGSHAWLGIPFAEPPVGELRWKAPRPPKPWTGTRAALRFGEACVQPGSPIGGPGSRPGVVSGSEDCLTLNVWAPPFEGGAVPQGAERLPVMVWIHGGGNSLGTAAFFDGGHLATAQRVLVITVQYRLGPLGWFRQASLRAGADDALEASGNFGTLDLIRALEWVRDNAAAFGGDPGNVTVFGESAGGLNVYSLLLAPRAKGLFHRAIVESGGLWGTPPDSAEAWVEAGGHRNSSSEVLGRLLVAAGQARDREEAKAVLAKLPDAEAAAFLRQQPAKALLEAYSSSRAFGMLDAPLVFKDGGLLPATDWREALAAGAWNQVPVLVGTNRDEAKLFLFLDPARVWRLFGLFPRYVDQPSYQAAAEAMSRAWKLSGADDPARAMTQSGAETFVYRWDWRGEPRPWGTDLPGLLGAAHGLEVPFVFGHFELGPLTDLVFGEDDVAERTALSDAMMDYWGQFARTGAPGAGTRGTLPRWTPWSDADGPRFMVLDVASQGGLRLSAEAETRAGILSLVDGDARLPTQKDKCQVFRALMMDGRGLSPEEYLTAGAKGCREFPLEPR